MLLAWLLDFAQKYVPVHSVDDCTVKSALQDWNQRISAISTEPMSPEWAVRYMKEILNYIRIRVDATPKPGAIHVASIHNGCFSGRCRTWIVGMDEHAWSIPAMQDPLLLDEERTAVSNDLQLVKEKTKKIRSGRDTRLSLVRGKYGLVTPRMIRQRRITATLHSKCFKCCGCSRGMILRISMRSRPF